MSFDSQKFLFDESIVNDDKYIFSKENYENMISTSFWYFVNFFLEIVLTPTRGALHTVTPGEECYYRFGSRTTSLSIQVCTLNVKICWNMPKCE